jgi:hypothetical protein
MTIAFTLRRYDSVLILWGYWMQHTIRSWFAVLEPTRVIVARTARIGTRWIDVPDT